MSEQAREVLDGLPLPGVAKPNIRPMRALGEMYAFEES
jgi:hypothetical protein